MIENSPISFWPFALSLLSLAVVLWTRAQGVASWNLIWRSAFNSRAAQQLSRELNFMESPRIGWLVLVFFLSFALVLFNLREFLGAVSWQPLLLFSTILVFLFVIYLVKILFLFLLQIIFEKREMFEEYLTVFMNLNIVLGVVLIPTNMLLVYSVQISYQSIAQFSIILISLSLIIRCIRAFQIGLSFKLKWYNIILYLCTLEIIPIMILMRMLQKSGIYLS